MKLLIVDDEPLARTALANILVGRSDVAHFDIACDAVEASRQMLTTRYDVILLDINMPEVSGTELLARTDRRGDSIPSVIFVTAHSEYAVEAFGSHAVDYVLKPFSEDRLNQALDLASQRSEGERALRLLHTLPYLQQLVKQQPGRLAIKSNGRIVFVNPGEVESIHAEGNYVLLQGEKGTHLLRESISVVAEKLKPFGFIRIHRSVLINPSFVEELRRHASGEYAVRIKGGKLFRVTRGYKANLKDMAASWIGVDGFSES